MKTGPEGWREGRRKLMETSFAQFEFHVRDQLDAALKGAASTPSATSRRSP
ncbi:MAG: hypothetical protein U0164_18930 [Gemmatimonadaceae bacterium]